MTREEAIDVLKHNYPSSCYENLCKAVDMAIKALEQPEPCEDTISRQAAIDEFDKGAWGVEWDKVLAKAMIGSLPYAQPEQRWIPCSERLPEDNREVEVTCEIRRFDGKKYRYTCHASYVHRYSIESTDYCNWEDCDEYNEEEDKYYALSGWYERVHNWSDYSCCAIEDFVVAWRELLEPYGGEQE